MYWGAAVYKTKVTRRRRRKSEKRERERERGKGEGEKGKRKTKKKIEKKTTQKGGRGVDIVNVCRI